jgi:hypothetical protein
LVLKVSCGGTLWTYEGLFLPVHSFIMASLYLLLNSSKDK